MSEAVGTDDAIVPGPGTTPEIDVHASSRWRGARPKRRLLVTGMVLLAVFVAVGIWQAASAPPSDRTGALVGPTGQSAPAFSLPNLSRPGEHLSLAAFRGKLLVLNFWASWCVPCRSEMPLLETAYRAQHGRVAFLGIAANDAPAAARAFAAEVHVTYPVVSDSSGAIATRYGVFGLPTTVFVSPSGKILGRHIGELYARTLREALKEAFGR